MRIRTKKYLINLLKKRSFNLNHFQNVSTKQAEKEFNFANEIMKKFNKNKKPFIDDNYVWHKHYYGHRLIHNPKVYPKSIIKKYHLGKKTSANNANDDDKNREKILLEKAKKNNHLWYGLM